MTDRDELLQTLREMLEEDRGESIDTWDEDITLREGLGLDSVDLITLVMQIQDRFRIVLGSEDLEKVTTVKDFLDLMQRQLGNAARAA